MRPLKKPPFEQLEQFEDVEAWQLASELTIAVSHKFYTHLKYFGVFHNLIAYQPRRILSRTYPHETAKSLQSYD